MAYDSEYYGTGASYLNPAPVYDPVIGQWVPLQGGIRPQAGTPGGFAGPRATPPGLQGEVNRYLQMDWTGGNAPAGASPAPRAGTAAPTAQPGTGAPARAPMFPLYPNGLSQPMNPTASAALSGSALNPATWTAAIGDALASGAQRVGLGMIGLIFIVGALAIFAFRTQIVQQLK